MATIRVNKTKDYTTMSNFHLREKEMSLKAKGLLSLMLSLPDNWDYSVAGLVSICAEKESAVVSTLQELKQFGYLHIQKLMPNETESGRIEYMYLIYEETIFEKQGAKKQVLENQGLENQGLENQGQLNTNKSITNKLSTNKVSIKGQDHIFEQIFEEKSLEEDLREVLREFLKMRKTIKSPMTERALRILITKLFNLSSNKQEQIEILEKSIVSNWKDIYPLSQIQRNQNISVEERANKALDYLNHFPAPKSFEEEMSELIGGKQ